MKSNKIIYKNGDNNVYDYFVLGEKSKIKLDRQSLSYKGDTSNNSLFVLNHENIQGNFDFVLEKKRKSAGILDLAMALFLVTSL